MRHDIGRWMWFVIGLTGCGPEGEGSTPPDAGPPDMAAADRALPPPPIWATLELSGPDRLAVGQTGQLTASPLTADRMTITNAAVEFASQTPDRIAVTPDGVVAALAEGEGVIRARFEGVEARHTIAITPAVPFRVALDPPNYTGEMLTPQTFEVRVLNAAGVALTIPDLTCESANPRIAEVLATQEAACVVRARSAGETRLHVRGLGVEGRARITIVDPPATMARLFDGFPDVRVGEARHLGPTFLATPAREVQVAARYTIDPFDLAEVDDLGYVTGVEPGYASLYVEAPTGIYEQPVYVVPAYMANEVVYPGPCVEEEYTSGGNLSRRTHFRYAGDRLVEQEDEIDRFGPQERYRLEYADDRLVRRVGVYLPSEDPLSVEQYIYEGGRLARIEKARFSPPANTVTHYEYDAEGRLSQVMFCRGLFLDGCVLMLAQTYDADGRLARSRSAWPTEAESEFIYDEQGRVERVIETFSDGSQHEEHRIRDGAGQVRFSLNYSVRPDLGGLLALTHWETFVDRAGNLRRRARLPNRLFGRTRPVLQVGYGCWE